MATVIVTRPKVRYCKKCDGRGIIENKDTQGSHYMRCPKCCGYGVSRAWVNAICAWCKGNQWSQKQIEEWLT